MASFLIWKIRLHLPSRQRAAQAAFLLLTGLVAPRTVRAAYCEGASHIACYEGVDQSGRSPGALYDAAVVGLSEAKTEEQRDLAKQAMKDAFNPAMSNARAVACNNQPGGGKSFTACVAGSGPSPGLKMSIPCQMNLEDGRLLVEGKTLPSAANYKVTHYNPTSTDAGWSHGTCEISFLSNLPTGLPSSSSRASQITADVSTARQRAKKEIKIAIAECMTKRLKGELPNYVASALCSNNTITQAFSNIHYPYMDLVTELTEKRLEYAQQLDLGTATEAEASAGMSKYIRAIDAEERRRDQTK